MHCDPTGGLCEKVCTMSVRTVSVCVCACYCWLHVKKETSQAVDALCTEHGAVFGLTCKVAPPSPRGFVTPAMVGDLDLGEKEGRGGDRKVRRGALGVCGPVKDE